MIYFGKFSYHTRNSFTNAAYKTLRKSGGATLICSGINKDDGYNIDIKIHTYILIYKFIMWIIYNYVRWYLIYKILLYHTTLKKLHSVNFPFVIYSDMFKLIQKMVLEVHVRYGYYKKNKIIFSEL